MLLQTSAAMGLAAWRFSPVMMVRLGMMGLELKVSSPSAVRYSVTSSSTCAWRRRRCGAGGLAPVGMVRGTTAPMASRWCGRSRVGEGKHVGAAAAQEAVDVEEEEPGARMRGSRAEELGHGRLGLASVVRARERRRRGSGG